MINGAHIIIYSKDAEADKSFIKNVLKFQYVDVNRGWLIFKLPPSEVAVHPSDENDLHELYLMTDDLPKAEARVAALGKACASRCDEFFDLKKAVDRYKANGNKYVAAPW